MQQKKKACYSGYSGMAVTKKMIELMVINGNFGRIRCVRPIMIIKAKLYTTFQGIIAGTCMSEAGEAVCMVKKRKPIAVLMHRSKYVFGFPLTDTALAM